MGKFFLALKVGINVVKGGAPLLKEMFDVYKAIASSRAVDSAGGKAITKKELEKITVEMHDILKKLVGDVFKD